MVLLLLEVFREFLLPRKRITRLLLLLLLVGSTTTNSRGSTIPGYLVPLEGVIHSPGNRPHQFFSPTINQLITTHQVSCLKARRKDCLLATSFVKPGY